MNAQDVVTIAQARWPTLNFSASECTDHVQTCVAEGAHPKHAPELCLAWACGQGAAAAISAFEREVVMPVAAKLFGPERDDHAAEVLQRLRQRMLVGATPGVLSFRARSSLQTFVRVAAARLASNLHTREVQRIEEALLELPAESLDLDVAILRNRYRGKVKAAIAHAVERLELGQRNALRLHYLDGMTLPELAALLGVSRATLARRLAAARSDVLAYAQAALRAEQGVATDDFNAIVRALDSVLSVSFERLLS